MEKSESYSLSEFNRMVGLKLKATMPGSYWVSGEINEIHVNNSGHCFLELIEKEGQGEKIVARSRANIWAYHFRMLHPYFKTMTGQNLSAGLKVMLQVNIEFHELYGISLQVTDINPAFTVGELAVQKQLVIQRLTDEGVIDMNRELDIPLVPQRIAVISSGTAAGYGDFSDQLHSNTYGYAFHHTLFPAVMQGNEAEQSIIRALEEIFDREVEFDVVVIIRGGGSQTDLNCFNSYRLAYHMAQFPLPIITGIGHERDETIADMVACIPLKTPTAVAEFLIDRAASIHHELEELTQRLYDSVTSQVRFSAQQLQEQSYRLQNILHTQLHEQEKLLQGLQLTLSHAVSMFLSEKRNGQDQLLVKARSLVCNTVQVQMTKIPALEKQLSKVTRAMLEKKRERVVWLGNKLSLLDPVKLLERGYSITLANGKVIRGIDELGAGQRIETLFKDGKAESVVEKAVRDL
ncbi:MAG: exodeoxyribonuclease VII large subunit [Bacteroidales bacterium]|jgi:exodeoxyribonuclease VII large subunit|nr:exodeoxyribonuclease VII large subunit [Bacteroidales bacterium]